MGQESLKAIYRFVSYNSEWIQREVGVTVAIGGGSGGGEKGGMQEEKPKLVPWGEKTFKEQTPMEMNNKIGKFSFFQKNTKWKKFTTKCKFI